MSNQIFNSSLGDYTQWVHSACPHWFIFHSTWSAWPEWKRQRDQISIKKVLRLLSNQTFNSSLRDYTQWVHSACPHWFIFPLDMVCPARVEVTKEVQISTTKRVLRLLPNQTFNSSLEDYTQWVHSACPHWFDSPLGMVCPARVEVIEEF